MRFQRPREWRKLGKLQLALALTCGLLLALGISLAVAGKTVESFFGELGSAEGQFSLPRDVAVHNGTPPSPGDIYVADDNNHRIQQFDSTGDFIRTWGGGVDDGSVLGQTCTAGCQAGSAGTAEGMFDNPQGIAVNQGSGHLYVRDRDNSRVQQFESDGDFVRAWGWGVDTGASAFEICTSTCQAGATGFGAGQFATSGSVSNGIAVAPGSGDVFVADPGNRRVQQFESDGDFVRAWGWGVDTGASAFEICTALSTCQSGLTTPGTDNGRFAGNQPVQIAVDSTGKVYASDSNSSGRVMRFDSTQTTAAALLLSPIGAPPLASTSTNSMEVDPSNDHLLIGRGFLAGSASIQELDTTTLAVVDTHMTGSGLLPNGLGIDSSDGELLVSSNSAVGGSGASHRVYVVDNVVAPEAEIAPVTDITSDSATFNGTVDPNGSSTGYHFEYSTDGVTWSNAPASFDLDAGAGDDPVPVSRPVDPLEPDTDYRVRLVATKPFAGGSDTSPETLFSTPPAPPTIVSSGATPGATTATLRGRIHPHGQATTYHFEYGLTDSYGSVVPVPDGDAGSGNTVQGVEESISGLEPSTTYHFRLVAENGTGPTMGPDRTFVTGPDPDPGPPERPYEKVSPEDKNGGDTQGTQFGQTGYASPSGNAVVYAAAQPFDDAETGGGLAGSFVRATRGPTSWENSSLLPPKEPSAFASESFVDFVSEDLSRSVVKTNAVLDAGAVAEDCNLYLRDNDARSYELLGHAGSTGCGFGTPIAAKDASPDLSSVLFETQAELTPDAVGVAGMKLYLWSEDAGLELASVLPAGTASTGSAGNDSTQEFVDNAISDDGSVVYFSAPAASAVDVLYRRSGGQTVAVSKEENSLRDPCGASGVCQGEQEFRGASPDGSRVFFTSRDQLVDEDTNTDLGAVGDDLYMYEHSADPDNDANLTLLSRDLEPGAPDGAQVLGVLGASDDGTRVYFAAKNQIVAGADSTTADMKFYVWDEQEGVRYLGGGVSTPRFAGPDDLVHRTTTEGRNARSVSGDGERVMLLSSIQVAGPDNGNSGVPQVYLYDFGADEFVCVSCPSLGERAPGCEHCGNSLRGFGTRLIDPGPRVFSDDGARAFFQTPGRLVPEDTNGKADVYMWERGKPHLVSTGRSGDHSLFIDASANGDDVFFGTREQLVPWDTDDLRDLYVARVGGGLPGPPTPEPPCVGDECQGTPAGPPALIAPFSDVFDGSGDLMLGERSAFAVRRLSRAQLAKLARGGRVMLPVRVNRAGRLSLTARAKMGKRSRVVDRSSKRARRAGTVGVPLQLSKASRRELARERKLRVSVSVRFAGVREPRTMTLRLQLKGGGG